MASVGKLASWTWHGNTYKESRPAWATIQLIQYTGPLCICLISYRFDTPKNYILCFLPKNPLFNMPSFTVFKGSKDGVVRAGTTTKPDQLVGDQVLLKVTASGLCGTGMLL